LSADELTSRPNPTTSYEEAWSRIDKIDEVEDEMPLQEAGRGYALVHGSRVETAVVVFHGYTDVTDQFSKVAQGYYDAGYNVWVPRMPYHGYSDRMTDDPSKITPEVLREAADENIDIAAGLGRNVEVIGISGGGALAAWAAAEREDVDRTVILSAVMLPKGYKPWMVRPMTRLVAALPDSYTWWTDKQADEPGPEYPRYSRHGITSYLMMVERAKADGARGARPVKGDVVIVSNLNDEHLDTSYPVSVMKPLVAEGRSFRSIVIPAKERLAHDLVGVKGDSGTRIRVAYRYLAKAIGITLPDPLGKPDRVLFDTP
jgi:carboxylesterase